MEIESEEVREAISEPVNTIVETVRLLLKRPPELAADIVDSIVLAGGGALIKILYSSREETGLPISIADNFCSVVLGSGSL